MISAHVICDSLSPFGERITTLSLAYPRFIHSEFLTHRAFSRNSASSRAIPIEKMIAQVRNTPAMPVWWGANQPGMQARAEVPDEARISAQEAWRAAALDACRHAETMLALGLHKQVVNRILEPWQIMKTIVTATEWDNFFMLRRHPDAQPEFKALADCMFDAIQGSTPRDLLYGQWHLPYLTEDEIGSMTLYMACGASAARCARVSYLNHDMTRPNVENDTPLASRLLRDGHLSPFEHQATPTRLPKSNADNFVGWKSYRYLKRRGEVR